MDQPHEYTCDDRDRRGGPNRLRVYPGGNGDWYVQILKPGERIGVVVRVSTSGTVQPGVVPVVARLYDALAPAAAETPRCEEWSAAWCPLHGDCTCDYDPSFGYCREGDDPEKNAWRTCPLHGPTSEHPVREGS